MTLSKYEKNIIAKKFNLVKDAYIGFPNNIDILVKLDITLDTPNSYEKITPLLAACSSGKYYFVEKLLKHNVNLEYQDKNGKTALIVSSEHGYANIVRLLLDHNVNINHKDKINKSTAIMIACSKGYLQIVKLLYNNGANINIIGENYYNCLLYSVNSGNLELVKFILDHCDCINYKTDISKLTGLMIAAKKGFFNIVKYLVNKECDITLKDAFDKKTAEEFAKENNNLVIYNFLKNKRLKRKNTIQINKNSKKRRIDE